LRRGSTTGVVFSEVSRSSPAVRLADWTGIFDADQTDQA
jgi:hypothetical protein